MAIAVKTIAVRPGFNGLFTVRPDQPDAIALALFSRFPAAQPIGKLEQDGGRRSTVVGTHISDITQRVIGVVVTHDDNNAVFGAGKFRNDVADRKFSFHGISGKGVVFYLIAFEVVDEVALQSLVISVAHVTRTEGGHFAGVREGALGIDMRERCIVGAPGLGWS